MFRVLFEAAPDAMLVVEAGGRIAHANRRATDVFGYPRDVLVGMAVDTLVPSHARPAHAQHRAGFVAEHQARLDYRHRPLSAVRADGSEIPVEITLNTLQVDGRTVVAVLVRDVSVRLELEARVRRAERLEALERMAGGVAHGFNNVVTGIRGSAELLRAELPAASPYLEDVDDVLRGASRADELTRELVAFARKQPLAPMPVDLALALRNVVSSFGPRLSLRGGLELRLGDTVPPVLADPVQLESALSRLIQYARSGPGIDSPARLTTSSVSVTSEDLLERGVRPGEYALLSIEWDEPALSDDPLPADELVEPFRRLSGRVPGMGLASVRGIIAQSGGALTMRRSSPSGLRIEILLPTVALRRPERASAGRAAATSGATVLVVDDEPIVLRLMTVALRAAGYEVLGASSAEDALSIALETDEIDLLCTDILLGGMDGVELAERCLTRFPDLSILLVSGYPDVEKPFPERALFLPKPFTPRALIANVEKLIGAPASRRS